MRCACALLMPSSMERNTRPRKSVLQCVTKNALQQTRSMSNDETMFEDYLDNVHDRKTFLDFVWALMRDRERVIELEKLEPTNLWVAETNGWYNTSIEMFLEAAIACVEAVPKRLPEEPSWKSFAEFLFGGKIYE